MHYGDEKKENAAEFFCGCSPIRSCRWSNKAIEKNKHMVYHRNINRKGGSITCFIPSVAAPTEYAPDRRVVPSCPALAGLFSVYLVARQPFRVKRFALL